MSDFDPTMAVDVIVASETSSGEAARVLSQVLGSELSLAVDPQPGTYDLEAPARWTQGSGLALACQVGTAGVLILLPDAGGVLPEWVRKPDTLQTNKLGALAKELAALLLPEMLLAEKFSATWLPDLAEGLARCEVAAGAAVVTIDITGEKKGGALYVVWPCFAIDNVAPPDSPEAKTSDTSETTVGEEKPAPVRPQPRTKDFADLPPYARHLLKIQVPVMVNLVSKKQSIDEIMQLGPGAIVNFEKSCDDPLELVVGNRRVALGSAVKVGDKFGIEITEISLPDESFVPVVIRRTRAG